MLSPKKKDRHIKQGSIKCPYCGSEDITGEEVEIEENMATQEVFCSDCERGWRDIYKLVDVEEIEED
jgi:hypothetical protein